MFESMVAEPVGDACLEGEPGPGDPPDGAEPPEFWAPECTAAQIEYPF